MSSFCMTSECVVSQYENDHKIQKITMMRKPAVLHFIVKWVISQNYCKFNTRSSSSVPSMDNHQLWFDLKKKKKMLILDAMSSSQLFCFFAWNTTLRLPDKTVRPVTTYFMFAICTKRDSQRIKIIDILVTEVSEQWRISWWSIINCITLSLKCSGGKVLLCRDAMLVLQLSCPLITHGT